MESQEEKSIRSVVKAYDEAWNDKNVRTITACFTDDAVFINPWGNVYRGKAELAKVYDETFKMMPDGSINTKPEEGSCRMISPELAIYAGGCEMFPAGAGSSIVGYNVFVMKKMNGSWLIIDYNAKIFPPKPS